MTRDKIDNLSRLCAILDPDKIVNKNIKLISKDKFYLNSFLKMAGNFADNEVRNRQKGRSIQMLLEVLDLLKQNKKVIIMAGAHPMGQNLKYKLGELIKDFKLDENLMNQVGFCSSSDAAMQGLRGKDRSTYKI